MNKDYYKKYRETHRKQANEYGREYYEKNKEAILKKSKEYSRKIKEEKPDLYLFRTLRNRCSNENLEFDLDPSDIKIPKLCPIRKVKLEFTPGKSSYNTPSVDRLNPKKGYIKGNVKVISAKANLWKSDMTLKDVKKLVKYMEKYCKK